MNNYGLFSFDNSKSSDINAFRPINEYKKNINYLYKEFDGVKPISELPQKFYRDEFLEQDIEIDIDSNKFREVWKEYKNKYNDINKVKTNDIKNISEINNVFNKSTVEENLDQFDEKVKELDKYLLLLAEERKNLNDKNELLELTKKELEQEKELLDIEKEKFEDYKKTESDKLNRDRLKFQNLVEDIKNKIETILN